jgi:1,4-alpha-glucan branching enzyme
MAISSQLEQAQCSHPFSVLGKYVEGKSMGVRAWLPGATEVFVEYKVNGKKAEQSLARVSDSGLFEGIVTDLNKASFYTLRVNTSEGTYSTNDPYQYDEEAFHAVHYIDHTPQNLYKQGGAQQIELHKANGEKATRFSVYAPNASAVSLIGDFNYWDGSAHPMQKTDLGFWVLVVPSVKPGTRYKYQVKDHAGNMLPHKADPLGFAAEPYPSHASIVFDHTQYTWNDDAWMASRQADKYSSPMSIYEVHLGSWKKPDDDRRYLNYKELAESLITYVKDMNYTHIELMPVSEFPFDGSWGYQPVGMFAPTSRFGSPDEFKWFVDQCHQNNIGVIIDWVPAHFPEDGHGLARFDGSCVYEYEDPRRGWHPDWNSCIYDFGKDTVRQFLVASALMWLDYFHIDGLRVDAVASMLYLDYSRNDGEWVPNVDGGNENYEAISLLRWMNEEVYKHYPDAMTIAEESTSFPKVSRPVFDGGLGFGFKWNMGWMHDSLHFISKDPAYRRYHQGDITFSMVYAFDENFVLPISHDEVVHGKGSLIGKMPGDEWQQAANLRTYAAFMYAHPGKKLNFMGNEIGQAKEWNHDGQLSWELLDYPKHQGVQALYRDLNNIYRTVPALYEGDHQPSGFEWIDHENAEQSVLSFARHNNAKTQTVCVVSNFTPVPRSHFKIGVPKAGNYKLILNTDNSKYWGSDYPVNTTVSHEVEGAHGKEYAITIDIPPLSTLYWVVDE